MSIECKPPPVQGLAEVHPTETPVADMKKRADLAIKDSELGGEGWAQMASRPNKSFPEVVKEFLREQFLKGEVSASEKVRFHHTLRIALVDHEIHSRLLLWNASLFSVHTSRMRTVGWKNPRNLIQWHIWLLPAGIDLSLIRNHMQQRGFLDMIQVLHFVIEFERHWILLQIKGWFSRYKKASGAAKTPNISVAAINSVYMDQEEEDAMLEAIQGIDLLLASWTWTVTLISRQFSNFLE